MLQVAHRLVVDLELVALQGQGQGAFQLQALFGAGLQFGAVAGEAGLAGILGAVHGEVGGAQHIAAVLRLAEVGDADAGAHRQLAVGDRQRQVQFVEHALGHALGVLQAGQVIEQGDELVAAKADQVIAGAQAAAQALGHGHQHLIADGMAEAVVDQFETVEVDKQQRGFAGAGPGAPLLRLEQQLLQAQAVAQAGQRVVAGGLLQVLLGMFLPADIALRAGQALAAALVQADHAAHQHPQVMPLAVADAVLLAQRIAVAVEVLLDSQAQGRQVFRVDAGEPAGPALAELVAGQAEHARPALREVQVVALDVPVPEAVVGAAQGAGVARIAAFQGQALGRGVGIDGQGHVEEHRLQQAGAEVRGRVRAEHRLQQVVQVQAVAAEVPLQLQADLVVDPADAQAIMDIVGVMAALPHTLVVVELAVFEALGNPGALQQGGGRSELAEVFVQLLDELLVHRGEVAAGLLQARGIGRVPVEKGQAGVDLLTIQTDAAQQRLQLFGHVHCESLVFLWAIKKR